MSTFNFKNVGRSENDYSKVSTKPYGIKTPWSRGNTSGYFEMNYDLLDQIRDNFKNMILTNYGERVMIPDYGANLKRVMFENMGSANLNRLIAENIYSTTSKYMPYISLKSLNIDDEIYRDRNTITIGINYYIPEITDEQQVLSIAIRF